MRTRWAQPPPQLDDNLHQPPPPPLSLLDLVVERDHCSISTPSFICSLSPPPTSTYTSKSTSTWQSPPPTPSNSLLTSNYQILLFPSLPSHLLPPSFLLLPASCLPPCSLLPPPPRILLPGSQVPAGDKFSLVNVVGDPLAIREWQIWGLPVDDYSTENGILATRGKRWPLSIDPQGQANK